ncbi:hypothetical protein ACFQ9X_15080 [Catenulispora yoronensis]
MIRQRNWLPQGGRRPLAPGTRPEDMAAELAYLHGRYPTMRTRLVFDLARGRAGQWLVSDGETFLDLYDTAPGQDPDTLAARVEAAYRRRPYDLRTEWPIRMAVIRADGACTHLVVLMHHLALDAGGAAVMMREVADRVQNEPAGMQPLEQAAWQASEAGRRHNDRTLRHFAQALRPPTEAPGAELPPAELPSLAAPHRPRHWSGRLTSPTSQPPSRRSARAPASTTPQSSPRSSRSPSRASPISRVSSCARASATGSGRRSPTWCASWPRAACWSWTWPGPPSTRRWPGPGARRWPR